MEKEVRSDPDSDGRGLERPELPQQTPTWERGSERDEYRLIVRAQAGDQAAFAVLYERYFPRLCRYVSCLVGNDDRGSELAQAYPPGGLGVPMDVARSRAVGELAVSAGHQERL